MLITPSENGILNRNNLRFDRAEATEAGLQVARLMNTVREKRDRHGMAFKSGKQSVRRKE